MLVEELLVFLIYCVFPNQKYRKLNCEELWLCNRFADVTNNYRKVNRALCAYVKKSKLINTFRVSKLQFSSTCRVISIVIKILINTVLINTTKTGIWEYRHAWYIFFKEDAARLFFPTHIHTQRRHNAAVNDIFLRSQARWHLYRRTAAPRCAPTRKATSLSFMLYTTEPALLFIA